MAKKSTTKEGALASAKTAPQRNVSVRTPGSKTRATKPAAKANGAEPPSSILEEVVALRAYFISEQRIAAGKPGDSFGDWLEAERQIREESK